MTTTQRRRRRGLARAAAGIVIGAGCLWLAVRGLDPADLAAAVRGASVGWIVAAGVLLLLSYVLRALRWGVILAERRTSFPVLFWSTGLGYLLNSLLPARAGDVARSAAAGRALGLSTARLLGSTVVERIVDASVLALALLLAVPWVDSLPNWLVSSAVVVGAASALTIVLLGVTSRRMRARPYAGTTVRSRPAQIVARFGSGLILIDTPRRAAQVMLATTIVWTVDVAIAMSLARAFGVAIAPLEAFVLLAAFGLASAAPSTPGFVGVFQAVAVGVLGPMGVAQAPAIAIASALQLVTLATAALATAGGGVLARRPDGEALGRGIATGDAPPIVAP